MVEAPTKSATSYHLFGIFTERQRVGRNVVRTLQRSKDTIEVIVILGGTVKDMRLLPRLSGHWRFLL